MSNGFPFYTIAILLMMYLNLLYGKESPSLNNAIGTAVGVPHTIAIVYERTLTSRISFQVHAGSVVLFSSAGIRGEWINHETGWKPYLFAGTVIMHSYAEDAGDPKGTTPYLWFGPGIRYSMNRWLISMEVCALSGGDSDKGIGDEWIFPADPALSGYILIRF